MAVEVNMKEADALGVGELHRLPKGGRTNEGTEHSVLNVVFICDGEVSMCEAQQLRPTDKPEAARDESNPLVRVGMSASQILADAF
jgi:hypothetical protein